MASEKKRRKLANLARKDRKGTPAIHADGDRRRRGGPTVEEALALKRAMQRGEVPPFATGEP